MAAATQKHLQLVLVSDEEAKRIHGEILREEHRLRKAAGARSIEPSFFPPACEAVLQREHDAGRNLDVTDAVAWGGQCQHVTMHPAKIQDRRKKTEQAKDNLMRVFMHGGRITTIGALAKRHNLSPDQVRDVKKRFEAMGGRFEPRGRSPQIAIAPRVKPPEPVTVTLTTESPAPTESFEVQLLKELGSIRELLQDMAAAWK